MGRANPDRPPPRRVCPGFRAVL